MLRTGQGLQALFDTMSHCLVRCWLIARLDGVAFRFTETNEVLVLADGFEYTPVGGVAATALSKQADLGDEANRNATGIVSHETIRHEDVRAHKFDGAEVREYVVDRRYPWFGNLMENQYTIVETRLNKTIWQVQFAGAAAELRQANGFILSRLCRNHLGDAGCKFLLPTEVGTVTFIDEQRLSFQTTLLNTQVNDYYKYGEVEFTSGDNLALVVDVKRYRDSDGRFWLRNKTRLDIKVGDTFGAKRGCPKTLKACNEDFTNTPNNGSYPGIPGGDAYNRTPDFI